MPPPPPPSPPPPPPSPPPPPHPPLPAGRVLVRRVDLQYTVAGDVASFDADGFKSRLAAALSISTSLISLEVAPASVSVTARYETTSANDAERVLTAGRALAADTTQASSVLGVAVEAATMPTITLTTAEAPSPPPSPLTAAAPPPSGVDGGASAASSGVSPGVGIVVGIIGLLILIVFGGTMYMMWSALSNKAMEVGVTAGGDVVIKNVDVVIETDFEKASRTADDIEAVAGGRTAAADDIEAVPVMIDKEMIDAQKEVEAPAPSTEPEPKPEEDAPEEAPAPSTEPDQVQVEVNLTTEGEEEKAKPEDDPPSDEAPSYPPSAPESIAPPAQADAVAEVEIDLSQEVEAEREETKAKEEAPAPVLASLGESLKRLFSGKALRGDDASSSA